MHEKAKNVCEQTATRNLCTVKREPGDKPGSSHTEQEESHAALQLQEITSVLMTQVSGERSATSADLKHTVHSLTAHAVGLCEAV